MKYYIWMAWTWLHESIVSRALRYAAKRLAMWLLSAAERPVPAKGFYPRRPKNEWEVSLNTTQWTGFYSRKQLHKIHEAFYGPKAVKR